MKRNQDRSSRQESEMKNENGGCGQILITGLFLIANSVCFFIQPRTTSSGLTLTIVIWALLQHLIRKEISSHTFSVFRGDTFSSKHFFFPFGVEIQNLFSSSHPYFLYPYLNLTTCPRLAVNFQPFSLFW